MKHLKKYKAFESVERGHEHSWEDIEEVMLYLKDVGFEYKEGSKTQKFVDSEGHRAVLEDAESLVTEFYMTKPGPEDSISRNATSERGSMYFAKWDDKVLDMNEAIASFCSHFDECYYSISLQFDKWVAGFIIITPVSQEDRSAEREENIKRKVEEDLGNYFHRFRNSLLDGLSKETARAVQKNKLGESMWGSQGSLEKGFLVCPFNLESIRNKRATRANLDGYSDRLAKAIGGKVEFREVSAADIDRLAELHRGKATREYFEERYLGLIAYIMEFDYEKLFADRLAHLS